MKYHPSRHGRRSVWLGILGILAAAPGVAAPPGPEGAGAAAQEAGAGGASSAWWARMPPEELPAADLEVHEAIDRAIEEKLAAEGAAPAPPAADSTIARRLTLDLAGRIPTLAEVKMYIGSSNLNKQAELIDRLMASPSFARHQASELDAMLMDTDRASLADYLRRAFSENRSWDRIFRELLEGGGPDAAGAEAFLRERANDPDRLTSDASVIFFGVNVSCAMCHDHPLVPAWKQDHYYGMKSFFNRTFESGGFIGERDYGLVSYKTIAGDSRRARLMFLSGDVIEEPEAREPTEAEMKEEKRRLEELKKKKEPPPPPNYSRRAQLIRIALEPGREGYFARAIVNRTWHRFFGHGLVMPLDQMHPQNLPSHPALLQWLARDLAEHGYDLRRLIRGIAMSRAYSRSSRWEGSGRPRPELFAVALPRPLAPRQYAVSLRFAATDPEQFSADLPAEELERRIEAIEKSAGGLSGKFDRPGEGFQIPAGEALFLSNSEQVRRDLLGDEGGRLVHRLLGIEDAGERVRAAVWAVLSRPAGEEEAELLKEYLEDRKDHPLEACEQMVWSLLTGAEFRFNY